MLRSAIFVVLGAVIGVFIGFGFYLTYTQPNLRIEYVQDDAGTYTKCVVNNWGGVSCDWEGVLR